MPQFAVSTKEILGCCGLVKVLNFFINDSIIIPYESVQREIILYSLYKHQRMKKRKNAQRVNFLPYEAGGCRAGSAESMYNVYTLHITHLGGP